MELLLTRPGVGVNVDDAWVPASASATGAVDSHRDVVRPGASAVPGQSDDFASCHARELPGLVWFVMSLGASAEAAAAAAQSAFTDAFPVWHTIRHPNAWLRRVAERAYYRRAARETLVESPPDRPGPLPTASAAELRAEARAVLAALASLPPKQRRVMAWCIDGRLGLVWRGTGGRPDDDPRESCRDDPRESCRDDPRESCRDDPRESCRDDPRGAPGMTQEAAPGMTQE